MGPSWSWRQVLALMNVLGWGGRVRPPSWTGKMINIYLVDSLMLFKLTVLDEVQSNAANDGNFIDSHGTKKLLDCDFLICNLGGGVKDIAICYADDLGLQPCRLCCCADIKVWGRKNGLTPQFAAVCRNEADESVPVWCHCVFVCVCVISRM